MKNQRTIFRAALRGMGLSALLLALSCCVSCGRRAARDEGAASGSGDTIRRYAVPLPPMMIAEPEKRAAYVAEKYWDAFDFRDTTWVVDSASLEQVFANYLGVLGYAPRETASASLRDMLRRSEVEGRMYRRLAELAESYLYEPNSPMRDYELYAGALDAMLASPVLDEVEKIRPAHQREMIGKNREGSVAADIRYETPDGRQGALSRLRTPYVLLFFHDPDCGMCRGLTAELDASPLLRKLIDSRRLTILTVYPDGEEQAWRAHAAEMPQRGWVHGWDRAQLIREQGLYDIRARPTLYLLGPGKIVVVKDGSFRQVEDALKNL